MSTSAAAPAWTRRDFASDQDVRWCPGCGDYVILAAVHRALASVAQAPHEHVFVSGIGCSSRFPYYMGTYGFHTIHGRAPAIASGIKASRPDLTVWIVTGDGDGLSIGANHLLHVMRRNIDVNILLFNNRIYGLTKGQYSPCSEQGKVTKTSPMGSIEQPINALSFAIASQATFVARTFDSDPRHMAAIFERACAHKGTAFVEIYQNCVIFNDGAHDEVTNKAHRSDRVVLLEDGQPLIFGALRNKGVRLSGVDPEVVEFDPAAPPADILVHDEQASVGLGYLLSRLARPDFPEPMGVFRSVALPVYEDELHRQIDEARQRTAAAAVSTLFRQGADTWRIAPPVATGDSVRGELVGAAAGLDEGLEEKDSYVAELEGDSIEKRGVKRVLGSPLSGIAPQTTAVTLRLDASVRDALERMRAGRALATVFAVDAEGTIVGLVTERDLLHRLPADADLDSVTVGTVMTPDPEFLQPTNTVAQALNFMSLRGYRRVLVGSPKGTPAVLTVDDVVDFVRERADA